MAGSLALPLQRLHDLPRLESERAALAAPRSFYFSKAAEERNAENLLIIRDEGTLMRAYRENFERHRAHSEPYEQE